MFLNQAKTYNPYYTTFQLLQCKRKLQHVILNRQQITLKIIVKVRLDIFRVVPTWAVLFYTNKQLFKFLTKRIIVVSKRNKNFEPDYALEIPPVGHQSWHPGWFHQMKNFGKILNKQGALLLVQGSYADGRFTPYSDVDLVVIGDLFSQEVWKTISKIEELILGIDPLQHHGVQLLDTSCLDAYWQMDLPIETIKKSKNFTDEPYHLSFKKIIEESYGAKSSVVHTLEAIDRFLQNKNKQEIGLWAWKYFLSQLMLLPVLFLEAVGKYVYKADSFELGQEYFSETAWYAMEAATKARNDWPHEYNRNFYLEDRETVRQPVKVDKDKVINYSDIALWSDSRFMKSLKELHAEAHSLLNANEN